MKSPCRKIMVWSLILAAVAAALPLSDSLPIKDHYSQGDRSVSRFRIERFLLSQDSSADYVDRSLGYKWSGHAVGALVWCVDIGIAAYEIEGLLDAIKNESKLDSAGKSEPFSNSLYKFTIPLTIGTEIASFIQQRLYSRSDYLLHKGALAFNASVARRASRDDFFDLHIDKLDAGEYKQGGLLLTEPALYGVLLDNRASASHSVWSWITKEVGAELGEWAGMYLGLALVSYLQEMQGNPAFAIDKNAQRLNLTIGASFAASSIACAIVSSIVRNKGVDRYNEAVPKRPVAPAPQRIIEGRLPAAPDSAQSGISEGTKLPLTDTTAHSK